MLLTKELLVAEMHSIMQRSSSFADLMEAIAINCELNANTLSNSYYEEWKRAGKDWQSLADKIRKVTAHD